MERECEVTYGEMPELVGTIRVTDPSGVVVYDGPAPCPEEIATITPEMLARGELFLFEFTPA
jgi:hypothetical protein